MSGRGPRLISVKRRTPLGDMELGALVKLNENGTPAEFYVARHNYEAGLNGNGRTLLVRKDCYDERAYSDSAYDYAKSTLDSWLCNTYLKLLDTDIQTAIGTTKFYYTYTTGRYTVTTLERAVFQLSLTELGKISSYAETEGTALPTEFLLHIAYINGAATSQWTRTPKLGGERIFCVGNTGNVNDARYNYLRGSRPAFTLPASTLVGDDLLIA